MEDDMCPNARARMQRHRFVNTEEIATLCKALSKEPLTIRCLVLLLIVAGRRLAEVISLEWNQVSLEKQRFSIATSPARPGRVYTIPITPLLRDAFGAMVGISAGAKYVFPSPAIGARAIISGWVKRCVLRACVALPFPRLRPFMTCRIPS